MEAPSIAPGPVFTPESRPPGRGCDVGVSAARGEKRGQGGAESREVCLAILAELTPPRPWIRLGT
eukprot:4198730-Pyramimonas_sp.AAC.1